MEEKKKSTLAFFLSYHCTGQCHESFQAFRLLVRFPGAQSDRA